MPRKYLGIVPIHGLFLRLTLEARASNQTFLDRLVTDWRSGANRFDAPGECFLGVYDGDALIACGGLNRDPYGADPTLGRLRHLYVAKTHRRQGVATRLVQELLARATAFRRVRLRTSSPEAAAFYERLGFARVEEPDATHAISLADAVVLGSGAIL